MPFIKGYLIETEGPVDPGYGVSGDRPAHPIAPGGGGPVDPGFGYPLPPVIWPTPPVSPGHPGQPLPIPPVYPSTGPVRPTYPVDPSYGIPTLPGIWPTPPRPPHPGHPLPPLNPVHPELPIYYPPEVGGGPVEPPSGGTPTPPIALPPGSVWPPLPPSIDGIVVCFVWIPGIGYRWVVIDTRLSVENPIQPTPEPKG